MYVCNLIKTTDMKIAASELPQQKDGAIYHLNLHADELAAGTVSLTTPESQLLVYHVMQPFTVTGISEVGIKVEPVSAFHTVASRVDTQQDEQQ